MSGPTVLVTGAAGHLGRAITADLEQRGAELALSDVGAANLGGDFGFATDLTDQGAVDTMVEAVIARFGQIDACVNAAGIEGRMAPVDELTQEEVLAVYEVNVFALFRVAKALLPHFKSRGAGRIVNIASGGGLAGMEFAAPYSSSKHAVVGLSRSLAREVAPHGIAVNAVCPGFVESPMVDRIGHGLHALTGQPPNFDPSVPMNRFADPAEIASVVAYLVLDAPAYLTGSALVIDGGLRA